MAEKVDIKKAANNLHEAMKGFGTNEGLIIKTLAGLDPEAIQSVREEFSNIFHKDLMKEISSETSFKFKEALVALLKSPVEYDTWLLHDSMQGLGTNDTQLIEVLVARHPDHLKKVVACFQETYNKPLEEWIAGDTSGHYMDYLLNLAAANRDSNTSAVSAEQVKEDAQALYRGGEAKFGTDEKVFIEIFAKRSWKHLRQISDQYAKQYSHSLYTALEKEFSKDLLCAFKWTLEFVENRQSFFAKRLYDSMKGLGTRDKDLIRIIISRRHVDLYEIAEKYKEIHSESLKEALHKELSGHYRDLMMIIVEKAE